MITYLYANHQFGLVQAAITAYEIFNLSDKIDEVVTVCPLDMQEIDPAIKIFLEKKLLKWVGHINWYGLKDSRKNLKKLIKKNPLINNASSTRLITPYNYGTGFENIASSIKVKWQYIYLYDDGIGNLVLIKNRFLLIKWIRSLIFFRWSYRPSRFRLAADKRQLYIFTCYPGAANKLNSKAIIYDISKQVHNALIKLDRPAHPSAHTIILPTHESNYRPIKYNDWIARWEKIRAEFEEKIKIPCFIKYKWDDSLKDLSKNSKNISSNLNAEFYVFNEKCLHVYTSPNSTFALAKIYGLDRKFIIYSHNPVSHGIEKIEKLNELQKIR